MNSLLILLLSLSFRTANLPDCPFDYQVVTGLKGKTNLITFEAERENGRYYWGQETIYKRGKIEFSSFVKTAKDINSQKISYLYPVKKISDKLSFGYEYAFQGFSNPKCLLTVSYIGRVFRFRYSKGFGRSDLVMKLEKKFSVTDKFGLVPFVDIRRYDKKSFWQFKVSFEYVIKK